MTKTNNEKHIETITIISKKAEGTKFPTDILSEAFDEAGNLVTWHVSSAMKFVPADMGMTSDWKHHWYDRAFPDGWKLVWKKEGTK